mmetsp:Transcript_12106/g.18195  ORF Transcript_12106/g.18195 Transcript_12106/m.18195 type:complete len:807 (+) Transcript_12106:96-2516(+)
MKVSTFLTLLGITGTRCFHYFRGQHSNKRSQRLGVAELPDEAHRVEIALLGEKDESEKEPIILEFGRLGRQAEAAVMARRGDTMVYTTLCLGNEEGSGGDFVPMSVEYQERHSASGRTSGAMNRREGRPADKEVLIARLIDRPLRPTIIDGWCVEIQIVSCVVAFDGIHAPDTLAILGASACLALSRVPTICCVGASRVVKGEDDDDELRADADVDAVREAALAMVVAGTENSVLMVEGGANFQSEATIIDAIRLAARAASSAGAQIEHWAQSLRSQGIIRPKFSVDDPRRIKPFPHEVVTLLDTELGMEITKSMRALQDGDMTLHRETLAELEKRTAEIVVMNDPEQKISKSDSKRALKHLCERALQRRLVDHGLRCDGRPVDQVRPIAIDKAPLPTAHGSAVFTRGETQVLATCTLGGKSMALRSLDALDDENAVDKKFYLQYQFPPSSVGETGRFGVPGRREVGHGALAERALQPAVPTNFSYAIRVESLVTESCGSSSMASVCGGCLAMMDAGVPIRHVAGIAMGLILPEDDGIITEPILLTDILGIEDALGSMDFKVAGDDFGISALQLDVKTLGLDVDTLADAVSRSRTARLHVLDIMRATYPSHRTDLASTVPRQRTLTIPPSTIGKLIGAGGRNIKSIIEDFGLRDVNVDDGGEVVVAGLNDTALDLAINHIKGLCIEGNDGGRAYDGPLPQVGDLVSGMVTDVKTFGAFCALDGFEGLEGLVHVSELAIERVRNIDRFIKTGQLLDCKVINVDTKTKKIGLSRKAVLMMQKNKQESPPPPPRQVATKVKPAPSSPSS